MYVMLVDDEVRICNGLAYLLLKKWPSLEVACLDNAVDALEAITARRPDLLITDICMPEMDGMELIDKARNLQVAHYAVLTGYDEFAFAQRAVKLQTMDYLLKPVEIEQLYDLVEKCMELETQAAISWRKSVCSQLRIRLQYNVSGEDFSETISEKELFGGLEVLILVLLSVMPGSNEHSALESISDLLRHAEQYHFLGQDQSGHWMVLCLLSQAGSQAAVQSAQHLKDTHVIQGYMAAPACLNRLHTIYQSALESVETGLEKAVSLWQAGNRSSLYDALDNLLMKSTCLEERLMLVWRFLGAVKCSQDIWEAARLFEYYRHYEREGRLSILKGWMTGLEKHPQPVTRQVIAAVDRIAQDYRQTLNLSEVAHDMYMTPSYFCTVFHQETGSTFVDYLNRVRINHACLCMMTDHGACQESVAAEVGFTNTPYFFKVFKKYTGMTPGAFRALIEKN